MRWNTSCAIDRMGSEEQKIAPTTPVQQALQSTAPSACRARLFTLITDPAVTALPGVPAEGGAQCHPCLTRISKDPARRPSRRFHP
jgi:hypothetical protein